MTKFLEIAVDKFTFKIATDRLYNRDGMWALVEGDGRVRIGLSDFLQQRSGDVAFAEIMKEGTLLEVGDELAVIETIKVNIELGSPLSGEVIEVNPAMEMEPEFINQDPYGAGWLVVIAAADMENESLNLLDPQTYFDLMKTQAEEEARDV